MQAALNGPMGRTILESAVLSIGSSPDNQLVLHDANVAEYQAEIRPDGQGYSITDLGSGSGTFVNGQRLAWDMPRKLNPGDMITIGDTTFTYETANTSPSQTGSEQAQVVSPVETVQPGAEENRQQETPQQDHSVAAGFFPAAFNASEHTAYGPSTPEVPGQAPGAAPTYGPSTPPTDGLIYAPPFPQPVYQGGMPGYPGAEPAAPTPAPPQPARRRTWLWISLVALVVLIAGEPHFSILLALRLRRRWMHIARHYKRKITLRPITSLRLLCKIWKPSRSMPPSYRPLARPLPACTGPPISSPILLQRP